MRSRYAVYISTFWAGISHIHFVARKTRLTLVQREMFGGKDLPFILNLTYRLLWLPQRSRCTPELQTLPMAYLLTHSTTWLPKEQLYSRTPKFTDDLPAHIPQTANSRPQSTSIRPLRLLLCYAIFESEFHHSLSALWWRGFWCERICGKRTH